MDVNEDPGPINMPRTVKSPKQGTSAGPKGGFKVRDEASGKWTEVPPTTERSKDAMKRSGEKQADALRRLANR